MLGAARKVEVPCTIWRLELSPKGKSGERMALARPAIEEMLTKQAVPKVKQARGPKASQSGKVEGSADASGSQLMKAYRHLLT